MAKSAAKVAELVGEIALASKEQSGGISQLNTAVGEMDKVVQQNAANAEESASSSEEMSAMAEQLNGYVQELVALVGSSNGKNGNVHHGVKGFLDKAPKSILKIQKKTNPAGNKSSQSLLAFKDKKVSPEKVIPMDDEFQDF